MLTHRERLQACLADDPVLDRPPVALWRHFPVDDQSPDTLAAASLDFQQRYDFDLVKVTPASSFCLADWGAEDAWEGSSEGTRRYTRRVVSSPDDWRRLPLLDPRTAPHLAGQLECLRLLRASLTRETPLVQTIFSPLAQARNLAGAEILLAHLRLHPEAVLDGLETIAETTRRFVEAAVETGIDGVFYAVQHAQAALLTLEEYRSLVLPTDQQVLAPARALWCNLLHLHGNQVYFELVPDFGLPIVNWHDRQTAPSLAEAQARFSGVVCGGISQQEIVFQDSTGMRTAAKDAILQTRGRRLLLGTGCVVPIIAPHGNLVAVREAV